MAMKLKTALCVLVLALALLAAYAQEVTWNSRVSVEQTPVDSTMVWYAWN